MLDQDTQAVIDQLRIAVSDSGLNQSDFARALGTSGSRFSTYMTGKTSPSAAFLARATRISSALAATRRANTPASLSFAAAIRTALARHDEHWALSMSLEARDRLRDTLQRRPELADAWDAEPSTGHERWDAFLGALIAHEFEEAQRPAPRWAARAHALPTRWTIGIGLHDASEIETTTPDWLAERGILISERDLATA